MIQIPLLSKKERKKLSNRKERGVYTFPCYYFGMHTLVPPWIFKIHCFHYFSSASRNNYSLFNYSKYDREKYEKFKLCVEKIEYAGRDLRRSTAVLAQGGFPYLYTHFVTGEGERKVTAGSSGEDKCISCRRYRNDNTHLPSCTPKKERERGNQGTLKVGRQNPINA